MNDTASHRQSETAARERLVAYLAGQVVAVVALTTLVGSMLGYVPFGFDHVGRIFTTDPVVRLAETTYDLVPLVLTLLYLTLPVTTVVVYGRGVDDRARVWLAAVFALVGPPAAGTLAVIGLSFGRQFGIPAVAALGVLGALFGWLAARLFDTSGEGDGERSLVTVALGGVAAVCCAGLVLGVVATPGDAGGAFTQTTDAGTPMTSIGFSYEPVDGTHGVLTVTHEGGDSVDATHLFVTGNGITAIEGADQGAGAWAGDTAARGDRQVVRTGDETTVGVTTDCEVSVVYRQGEYHSTLNEYDCGDGN